MIKYNELLKKYGIKPISYLKKGRSLIINTKDKKYVLKENEKKEIYDYLNNRKFKEIPKILILDKDYLIYEYIDDIKVPEEQKLEELIKVVATLHKKTAYYEKIETAFNKEIYEDLKNNIEYLKSYYEDIIALIDKKEFMSPSDYLFARNYTVIINSLKYASLEIDKWYQKVKDSDNRKVVVLHGNLNLDHFISGRLISFRKSKFDSPIFDLLTLFRTYGNKYDFKNNLKLYASIFPIEEEETMLLNILMMMPPKFEFKGTEYDMCEILAEKISLLHEASKIVLPNQFEN